ncbi:radical SAM protein [Anaerobranca gottschalkii]|uniref:Fe-S oxidoreductase n=1 Tax=Anaerobranca gottschalkii DSM 13577 TaxID=1120990 RepID=A0A1H9YQN6_9FIRM|nr:radical SAM protein [Anaerobranca gottschalkii]SES71374.1 Fe-S oxidoreductase [Anaerobranca gottschalkii DSM 13577]
MYNYPLYRPPSEAYSLILQLSHGCSHNKCTFCYMYKDKNFYIKSIEEIKEHINWGKEQYPDASRIFLADGNALVLPTPVLLEVLQDLKDNFPYLQRISCYAAPKDLLKKGLDELKELQKAGLSLLYLGVESGCDGVLKKVNKGVTSEEMIIAGKKAIDAGFQLSTMVILGLGGKKLWRSHAEKTAEVISAINPNYFSPLTLMLEGDTPLAKEVQRGEFELLSPDEIMEELRLMIENLDLENCVFRCNHASNYVPLKGILNKDKAKILAEIEGIKKIRNFKNEFYRGL